MQVSAGCPRGHVPATFRCIRFRERRVAVALSRERALLHFTTLFRGQREYPATRCRERTLLHCYAHCADSGVSPWPYTANDKLPRPCSANARYCIILLVARTAEFVNNITMPRSVRRLRRAPFYCFKQIAHARHPTLCWVMRSGAFAFAEHIKYSLASRKTAAFAGGVSPPPYSANGRYCIVQPYSADSEVAMPPYPCFTRNDNCTRSLLKAEFTAAMSF